MDLTNEEIRILTPPADLSDCQKRFTDNAMTLTEYGKTRNITVTIESIPACVYSYWTKGHPVSRLKAEPSYPLPIDAYPDIFKNGLWFANDFCHTAGNFVSDDRTFVESQLRTITEQLAERTKLLHLSFLVPPYNGTDFHDQLDNPIFDSPKAIPNRSEMTELLKLFSGRPDVYALVEPQSDHPKNYRLAQKLLSDAGVLHPQN
jgi:hypothetical protein